MVKYPVQVRSLLVALIIIKILIGDYKMPKKRKKENEKFNNIINLPLTLDQLTELEARVEASEFLYRSEYIRNELFGGKGQ